MIVFHSYQLSKEDLHRHFTAHFGNDSLPSGIRIPNSASSVKIQIPTAAAAKLPVKPPANDKGKAREVAREPQGENDSEPRGHVLQDGDKIPDDAEDDVIVGAEMTKKTTIDRLLQGPFVSAMLLFWEFTRPRVADDVI